MTNETAPATRLEDVTDEAGGPAVGFGELAEIELDHLFAGVTQRGRRPRGAGRQNDASTQRQDVGGHDVVVGEHDALDLAARGRVGAAGVDRREAAGGADEQVGPHDAHPGGEVQAAFDRTEKRPVTRAAHEGGELVGRAPVGAL